MEKLRRPLLVHTNTNDRDVAVVEVEHLIAQLDATGKDCQSKIDQDARAATASTAPTAPWRTSRGGRSARSWRST